MLLGLDILNSGFTNIINNKEIYTIIQNIQNSNILSILFGILSTAIIQSSSGIIGIVEGLYETHLTSLESSIAIMLGANIGTTLTGYLAIINTSKETKTIINLNLIFNILGVVLFALFFVPFCNYIRYMQNNFFTNNLKFSIAFAHFIFNLISVILGYLLFDLFTYYINKKELS
jgi:phosphate:Na+ symporter